MCWHSKIKPIKRVAEKDIPVKKILLEGGKGRLYSPVYSHIEWEIGVTKHDELEKPELGYTTGHYNIEYGFHSCDGIQCDVDYTWQNINGENLFTRDEGECLYDAVIPAGSEYYVNEFGDYVSNQLRIVGKSSQE